MKINTVPKRAFEETPVIGCLSMPQLAATMAIFIAFAVPFMRGVTTKTTSILLIGIFIDAALYMFFESKSETRVGYFHIWLNELLAGRKKSFCGKKETVGMPAKTKKCVRPDRDVYWYAERNDDTVDVVDLGGVERGGTNVQVAIRGGELFSAWRTSPNAASRFLADAAFREEFCVVKTTVRGETAHFAICSSAASAYLAFQLGGRLLESDTAYSLWRMPDVASLKKYSSPRTMRKVLDASCAYSRRVLMLLSPEDTERLRTAGVEADDFKTTVALFCLGIHAPTGYGYDRTHGLYIKNNADVREALEFVAGSKTIIYRRFVSYARAEGRESMPPPPPLKLAEKALWNAGQNSARN